ncbi:hypothetical protein FO519_007331 [Halicephalobus sp. NKZ332]|nr:hypothetical protein FO519_007331 [Halicephalobus sp. NKZ332]
MTLSNDSFFSLSTLKTFVGNMRSNGGVMPVQYLQNGYPDASGDHQRHRRRPTNTGSKLLTDEENFALFNLIGTNCVSLTAGVCQLFRAEYGKWRKVSTGVISLVKDYNQKSYCLRMLNLQEEQLIFQQTLYSLFRVKTNPKCSRFLVFEGESATYGLNFSEDFEAESFGYHLQKRYEQELRSTSINSKYLEQDSSLRPIAEVKPFFVYSTTEQAVASAEQRLYDAVSTLTRRRAAVTPTPKTYSTPMNSRRNAMTPQPVMGTSRGAIWPNHGYGYPSSHVNRSVSIGSAQQDFPYSISRQNSTVGVTIGRRSFYPVYRGCNINSPPVQNSFGPVYRTPMEDFVTKRYPQNETYFGNRSKEGMYNHPYLDNRQHSDLNNFVHDSQVPSHYAMFNNAGARMHSGDRANKVFDSLEWTHYPCSNNNSLSVDEFPSSPTIDSLVRQTCRSCNLKGVDCGNGGAYNDIGQKRKQSKSSPPLNRISAKEESEKYFGKISNIAYSSSSSAYSSGSTPPEPVGELSINTNDKIDSSMMLEFSYSRPTISKINVAPPRPDSKPRPPKTIAAVSPNHVSTISIPEINELRPTSTIPFEKSSMNKERPMPKRYFTLRPTRPPPPPPHRDNRSFTPVLRSSVSTSTSPVSPRRNKKGQKAEVKRAHSKITLVDNFFQTDKSHPNGSSVGITSIGAVSHINNMKHLEENTKANNKKGKKKDKKPKIRKEDIGNPINFQHKAHIGWDQDGGFSQQMFDAEPMDDSVRALLTAAGQNPDKMKPDDIKFVYKFLESWDASETKPATPKYTSSSQYPTPPAAETMRIPVVPYEPRLNRPLPSLPSHNIPLTPAVPRHEQAPSRPPPPPPPPVSIPNQNPPAVPGNRSASVVPSGISSGGNQGPPPAPPPPPPIGGIKNSEANMPKATGARANLLSEIHAGARLKHVDPPVEKSPIGLGKVANSTGNARDDVMNAIKQGANLRHVNQSEVAEKRKSITATQNLDGIAGALARALEKRRNQMNQSDSEDGDDSSNEWEDD